jgi:hypothetical protein
LIVAIMVNLLGVALSQPLYPWIDLVALVVAWSGGLLGPVWIQLGERAARSAVTSRRAAQAATKCTRQRVLLLAYSPGRRCDLAQV